MCRPRSQRSLKYAARSLCALERADAIAERRLLASQVLEVLLNVLTNDVQTAGRGDGEAEREAGHARGEHVGRFVRPRRERSTASAREAANGVRAGRREREGAGENARGGSCDARYKARGGEKRTSDGF